MRFADALTFLSCPRSAPPCFFAGSGVGSALHFRGMRSKVGDAGDGLGAAGTVALCLTVVPVPVSVPVILRKVVQTRKVVYRPLGADRTGVG